MRGFRSIEGGGGTEAAAWRARMRVAPRRHPQWSGHAGGRRSPTAGEAIAEAEAVGELSALAHACYALDLALCRVGRAEEATQLVAGAGDLRTGGRSRSTSFASQQPRERSLTGTAAGTRRSSCIAARQRARSAPAGRQMPRCQTRNIGEILSDQGHLDDAEAHFRRARRVLSATGDRQWVALRRRVVGSADRASRGIRGGPRNARGRGGGSPQVRNGRLRRSRPGVDRRSRGVRGRSIPGDGPREPSSFGRTIGSGRCLPAWPGLRSRGWASSKAAMRELEHSLRTARARGADYDIAATIDAMAAIDGADSAAAARAGRDPRSG